MEWDDMANLNIEQFLERFDIMAKIYEPEKKFET